MSIEDRDMGARAAEREQRLHHAAAARQTAKEASDDDANADRRHSAFGRPLAWLRRSSRGGAPPMSPGELVVVEVAGNEAEAEMLCSLLRSAGIACMPRLTSRGAGAGYGWGVGGQHEIMVKSKDAQAARKVLRRPRGERTVTLM
jgi:hypothetical protein